MLLEHDVCVTLLKSESISAFLDENPQLSTQLKIEHLNKRILSRLENELMGKEIQYSPEEKRALIRFYRQYFGPKKWKYSTYDIYSGFLKAQEKKYKTVFVFDADAPDLYDLAALTYIYKRTKENDPIEEAHHVVIDEAQDFGMMAYMSLHYCMRGCTYTIMGDVAQNIVKQLKDKNLGEALYLPRNVLRSGADLFLDDYTLADVEGALQVPVNIVKSSGYDLVDALLGEDASE